MKTVQRLFNVSIAAALLATSFSAFAAGASKTAAVKSQSIILNCRVDNENIVIYQSPGQFQSEPAVKFSNGKATAQFQAEAYWLGRDWDMLTSREDYISLRNLKTGQNSFLTFTKGPRPEEGAGDGVEAAASVAMKGLLTMSEDDFLKAYGQHREDLLYVEGNKISQADCLVPEYSLRQNIDTNLDETMDRAGEDYSKNTEYLEKLKNLASTFKNKEAREAIIALIAEREYRLALPSDTNN